jgi:hypothetical protein
VGKVIVNMVRPSPLDELARRRIATGEVDAATIGAQLEKVGVPSSPGLPRRCWRRHGTTSSGST